MTKIPATMQVLEQKSWFRKARYELRGHGMYVFEKTLKSTYEEEFRYEEISNRISRIERRHPWLMALNLLSSLLAIKFLFAGNLEWAAVFIATVLGLLLVIHLISRHQVLIYLRSGLVVHVDARTPDTETVDGFIEAFVNEKRRYMVAKYGSVDKDLPIEQQLEQLIWLRNEDYIDEQTLHELKNKLLGKQQESRIGFQRKED